MTLPDLSWMSQGNQVTVCDETSRQREGRRAVASVTLGNKDSSWGEFLSRDEVLALHAWLGLLLEQPAVVYLPSERPSA